MSKHLLALGKHDHGILITHDEFAEAQYEEPWRYERVKGRLVVMNPAGHDHQARNSVIRNYLGAYQLNHPDVVEFVFDEAWIVVDDDTERIADIGVYLTASTGRTPERVPELIFEVVSDGSQNRRRDYADKRAEFERLGVQEYVVVDRFDRVVTVFRLVDGRYDSFVLSSNDTYSTSLLPGLEIPLKGVL